MNISDINVIELKNEELISISGGDKLTRRFFSWLGDMAAVIGNAMESDAQYGAHGHI
ncbi:hypothetical protein IUY40_14405 [Flavobacterium sp. ALJ2]|uniref:hypothetical protein n=1 Tax=Flavobacterium sp. ALJ2 TaxID=2786960 RepID=UPI00189E4671|nr:hypothetical protein [Flavobacterium sp. ALJ2]MBF7092725.1 hypothetical protein [Flavobacterium sp. ALJ2]